MFDNIKDIENHLNNLPKTRKKNFAQPFKCINSCIDKIFKSRDIITKNRFIHITGTNGKGSTATYLSHFLCAHNIKCALFTSPHILNITERIKYCNNNISEENFINIFNNIYKLTLKDSLTYFEYLFLIALYYFDSLRNLDIIILEVGIGGKKDITNIIKTKIASIVTYIDYDHKEFFNNNLAKIIYEKLGIIDSRSDLVFLGNDNRKIVGSIVEFKKYLYKFKFYKYKKDFIFDSKDYSFKFMGNILRSNSDLPYYQQDNVALALAASYIIIKDKFKISFNKEKVKNIINTLSLPIRMQLIHIYKKLCILDGAHNISAIKVLLDEIKIRYKGSSIIFIYHSMESKPYVQILNELKKFNNSDIYIYNHPIVLGRSFKIKDSTYNVINNLKELDSFLKVQNQYNNIIVFTGSIYFVSYILSKFTVYDNK